MTDYFIPRYDIESAKERVKEATAAEGQAFNLAVLDAICVGKQEDDAYIYSRYVKYQELRQDVQNLSGEQNGRCRL